MSYDKEFTTYLSNNTVQLWLSGKVMERENKLNKKIPGLLPSPGNHKKSPSVSV
jgi:hypothetical protein